MPWSRIILSGGKHLMMGVAPAELRQADTLNIFIEADGKPVIAFELATDIGGNSVYIGWPCQYLVGNHLNSCNKALRTSHRYSQLVIDSINRTIMAMKTRFHTDKIRRIGFFGGGTVATIIGAKRGDIALLVTVAGNLDPKRWADFNHSAPLYDSLSPVDYSTALESIGAADSFDW
ncbi:alpha/beta hydrolase [Methylophaga sp. OBS4]|uniref:alpha/beta hydrolase n=1 Tax=Methylophaga sp. OBS4 TaxID=2991935 RepID=UPI002256CC15|nr:alpha/beta hydrolase [Methylophaga sp. OBS4]MCX4187292.1 alpha/beta hydrolase [Methylophaga sp. OBS4]